VFMFFLIIDYTHMYHVSCVFSFPNPIFSCKVLTSRIAVLHFAGVFKSANPANGEGLLHKW
jgi:hypothetical protein